MPSLRGIVFDKDGTLIDYAATWNPVNRLAAEQLAAGDPGLAERLLVAAGYDREGDRYLAGSPLAAGTVPEIVETWAQHLPGQDAEALVTALDRIFDEAAPEAAVPLADLVSLFYRLKDRGLVLGIATSDSEAGARRTFRRLGVLDHLDFVAGYDSGHGVKPGPGMVVGFCKALGLEASEVAVVGDNLHDLAMGRAAGAGLVIGVLSGTGSAADLEPWADHMVEDVAEVEALLDSLGRS